MNWVAVDLIRWRNWLCRSQTDRSYSQFSECLELANIGRCVTIGVNPYAQTAKRCIQDVNLDIGVRIQRRKVTETTPIVVTEKFNDTIDYSIAI